MKLSYPSVETLKEGLRIVYLAILAAAVTALAEWLGAFDQTEVWVVGLTFVLKLADKYVHKSESTRFNGVAFF